jgi:hypothetical protein
MFIFCSFRRYSGKTDKFSIHTFEKGTDMTRNQSANAPLETLWDGNLKATIWQNTSEGGKPYHTVSLSRLYEDRAGKPQESNAFSATELLRIAELAREAYATVLDIRRHFTDQVIEPEERASPAAARTFQNGNGPRQRGSMPR